MYQSVLMAKTVARWRVLPGLPALRSRIPVRLGFHAAPRACGPTPRTRVPHAATRRQLLAPASPAPRGGPSGAVPPGRLQGMARRRNPQPQQDWPADRRTAPAARASTGGAQVRNAQGNLRPGPQPGADLGDGGAGASQRERQRRPNGSDYPGLPVSAAVGADGSFSRSSLKGTAQPCSFGSHQERGFSRTGSQSDTLVSDWGECPLARTAEGGWTYTAFYRIFFPNADSASSTASEAVRLCSSMTGFTSTISKLSRRPWSAMISIARWASR